MDAKLQISPEAAEIFGHDLQLSGLIGQVEVTLHSDVGEHLAEQTVTVSKRLISRTDARHLPGYSTLRERVARLRRRAGISA